jgi:hypothetical protein
LMIPMSLAMGSPADLARRIRAADSDRRS